MAAVQAGNDSHELLFMEKGFDKNPLSPYRILR